MKARLAATPLRSPGCEAQLAQALAKQRAGRVDDAAALLTQAIERWPRQTEPHLRLGNLLAGLGRWAQAEVCYAEHHRLLPGHAVSAYNLGVVRQELGRYADAVPALTRAVVLQPAYADAHFALALSHQRLQDWEAARAALEVALRLKPDQTGYRLELARLEVNCGRWSAVLALLDSLPDDAEALNLRGITLRQLQRGDEAKSAFDRAIALRPDFAEALGNRGNLLLLSRHFSAAVRDFDAALALRFDAPWQAGLRLYAASHLYDWAGFDERLAAVMRALAQGRPVVQPLALQCLVDDPQAQLQAARVWAREQLKVGVDSSPQPTPHPDGRIRLAYVSRDFRSHPVSFLMAEVFELHDASRFELIGLNYGPVSDDPLQRRARAAFAQFHDVQELSDREIVALARRLNIEIAVDLTGLTEGARTQLFVARLAPVQMLYLGSLGTAGNAAFDYLVADHHLVPPEARADHDERLLLLPCYQANDRKRPRPKAGLRRSELGLPEAGFVLCCFNNPCKINPAQFAVWAEILRRVPQAVLWLLDEDELAAAQLRAHAVAAGLDPARLVLAARTDRETYLARLALADLFLDTLPYNAGTTASDALWMGLPVLTLPGRAFAARVAASLLHAVALPELIASSAEDYVARAVRLATEPQALTALRERLEAAREHCVLFDTPRFVRSWEQGLSLAHRASVAGQPSQDIVLR